MESFLLVPIKFVSLSVQIAFGFPVLSMNLINARRKLSVFKSPTKSKCTACVVKQTKTAP